MHEFKSQVYYVLHSTYLQRNFPRQFTKAKFWLAVCSNLKLGTVFKDLLYLDNHLQQVGDHQAPAEGGRVRLVLPVCRTADETFRHSLTKAKFWLAVCSNLKL